jgi:hypothetical protein
MDKHGYQTQAVDPARGPLSRGAGSGSVLQRPLDKVEGIPVYYAPLELKAKVICFICGFLFVTFFPAYFFIDFKENKRGLHRADESFKWLWIGLDTMLALSAILLLLIAGKF